MALSPISYTCRHCNQTTEAMPKRTFLGFRKVTCTTCQQAETFPLTKGYRAAYYGVVTLMVMTILIETQQGNIGLPGLLGALVIAALVMDLSIKKKTKYLLK